MAYCNKRHKRVGIKILLATCNNRKTLLRETFKWDELIKNNTLI